jgi:hypothetical protein
MARFQKARGSIGENSKFSDLCWLRFVVSGKKRKYRIHFLLDYASKLQDLDMFQIVEADNKII